MGNSFRMVFSPFPIFGKTKKFALFCRKSKTGRTINTVRGTTCVRRPCLRTQNPITAAGRCRLLTLGGRTPERLPPGPHGSLHPPLPLFASCPKVLLSIAVFSNMQLFYCIRRRKSSINPPKPERLLYILKCKERPSPNSSSFFVDFIQSSTHFLYGENCKDANKCLAS